ncbi:MAG: site-2 protease family protein [Treponema sp.]|jgi:regulator of sigma E protease|nr:site-2 protease family protein [Treponema sp.]
MLIVKILLGLFGLGIVVFFHELGHFLAARLVKINVEAFSIGWGNPLLKKKIGDVEYRIGMFPVGGYCKMQGESDYKEAWENMNKGVMPEKGSFLAASPAARILVSFAGPFFNLLFAVVLLSFIWGFGFEVPTFDNKIVLASELKPGEVYPADTSGLKTGDRIIQINGQNISYFHELREIFALNPDKSLTVTVERDGQIVNLQVTPALEKSTGAGKIGVSYWADPVIGDVIDGSSAAKAGLLPGDIIISANGENIRNSVDFSNIIGSKPDTLTLVFERNGAREQAEFTGKDLEELLGFSWSYISYRTPNLSLPQAVAKGVYEGSRTVVISIKSLGLLFKGIDLTQAVSGPARITYMMGDMATQGFEQGFGTGLRSIANFIAIISILLCVMNLLPLPIIDGGMIILFLVEMIRGKPAHPKAIAIFQTCGMVIIFSLMVFALFGDILFFVRGI